MSGTGRTLRVAGTPPPDDDEGLPQLPEVVSLLADLVILTVDRDRSLRLVDVDVELTAVGGVTPSQLKCCLPPPDPRSSTLSPQDNSGPNEPSACADRG